MYTSHKFEKVLAVAELAQTPAVKQRHYSGLQKQVVRAVAGVVNVAMTVTASVWQLKKRPTPGSSSGESIIASITIPTAAAIGAVYYKRGLNVELLPGDELILELITAATAGSASFVVELDQAPEIPGNVAEMVLSA